MSKPPYARLCTVRRSKVHHDYGFSLNAVKNKIGHFISDVSEDHSAYAAGLRNQDFVVEVNGINVVTKPHSAVVDLIRSDPDQFVILVVDNVAKQIFDEKNISINSKMDLLVKIECPASNQGSSNETAPTKSCDKPTTSTSNTTQPPSQNDNHRVTELRVITQEQDSETEEHIPSSSDCTSDIITTDTSPRNSLKVEMDNSEVHTACRRQRTQNQTMSAFSYKKGLVDQL